MSLWDALDNEAGVRGDAETASMFFARELEHVKAQTYDVIRAPLRAFDLIPTDSTAGSGAESVVYEQYDMTGLAKIIADYADDLPRSDVKGKQFVARVRSVGNSYGYSLQEIRAAQMAGKPLQQRKANAATRSQRELWNRIAFYGDDDHGLQGWLTNTNIPSDAVENDGTGDATEWSEKTPELILRDMNDLVNGIVTRTNGAEQPDTLVLPLEQYTKITTTRADSGTDTTIAQYFLNNSPFVNSLEWSNEISEDQRTANMGENDPYTGDIMIAYRRDPDALMLEMPQMFEQLPVQERGLEFVVPCHSRIAGVIIPYPLSMAIGEGI